jgi:1-deoxy-D-xylulose-5-phosphate reductoisomerase
MRLAIAYALGMPERLDHAWGALSFTEAMTLSFEPPDRTAFPALDLADEAGRRGGSAPAWLSGANEVAVEAFLDGRIEWRQIIEVVAAVMARCEVEPLESIEQLVDCDARARTSARAVLSLRSRPPE